MNNMISESATLKDFLDSLSNKNTKELYERGIHMFCAFTHLEVDSILEIRKADLTPKPNEDLISAKQRAMRIEKEIEKFYLSLTKDEGERKAYSPSSAYNYTKGILQLLRYFNMSVALRKGSPILEGSRYEGEGRYELSIDDIRKMFWKARDLKRKLVLSMALDLGWRVSDFLSIEVHELPNLEQPTPLEFKRETQKEHTKAHTCLSKTTVELLKEYINVYELKPESRLFTDTEETINRSLRELASEVGLVCKPKLSFHCFRDLVIRTAQNLGIDVYLYKRMVGKTISRDMRGYSSKDVKEAFEKIQSKIAINGQILASEHHDLLTQLGQQVTALSTRLEQQSKSLEHVSGILSLLLDATDIKPEEKQKLLKRLGIEQPQA